MKRQLLMEFLASNLNGNIHELNKNEEMPE